MSEFTKNLIEFTDKHCQNLDSNKSDWYKTVVKWVNCEINRKSKRRKTSNSTKNLVDNVVVIT